MELIRSLGALVEPPTPETAQLGSLLGLPAAEEGDYERVFLFQLYPYASVYLDESGKLGGEARDRIAGFWRALELDPPDEPDHLATMLGLYARLAELEAEATADTSLRAGWRHARTAWFWEHLMSWLPIYLDKVEATAPPFYAAWAHLTRRTLDEQANELEAPDALPLHLREARQLEDPRESGGVAFLETLLSPVRSGFLLLHDDLARAARELGLGLRAGERRYALEALLDQDASATLTWLATHAAESAGNDVDPHGKVDRFWRLQASASQTLLAELADQARELRDPQSVGSADDLAP